MRTWTVDDANAALPRVGAVVERIAQLQRRIEAARRGIGGNGQSAGNGDGAATARAELEGLLAGLDADGIVVRDAGQGLVDFPAETADGRRYWLCWMTDEPAIEWWHWLDAGFAGRQRLSELPR